MGGGSSVHFDCVGVFDCGASHQSCGQGENIRAPYLFGNEFIMSLRPINSPTEKLKCSITIQKHTMVVCVLEHSTCIAELSRFMVN